MTDKHTNEEEVKETEETLENNEAEATVEVEETTTEPTDEKEDVAEAASVESNNIQDEVVLIEDEEFTDEELAQLEDGDFDEADLEEGAPKGKLSKHMGKILYSLLGVMIVAVLLFSYYIFPFYSKIGGTWNGTSSAGSFKVVNSGSKSEFSILNMNGIEGMDLVFTSKLNRKGVNQYDVKDTKVTIVLNKKKVPAEQINEFKGLTEQVKVKSESKKEVVLTYTDAAYKSAFSGTNIDSYFNYRLTNFNFALQGKSLLLKNKAFATTEISFTHK